MHWAFQTIAAVLSLMTALACARGENALTTAEDALLLSSVQKIGAQSGQAADHRLLCDLSEQHVDYMIDAEAISHDGFDERSEKITNAGGNKSGEIVAMNCGQTSAASAAQRCAIQWQNSPGHHKLMHQSWNTACYRMKRSSSDGCYYCIGLFANGL